MKVKVKILSGGVKEQDMEVSSDSTYEELLESLHINPEIVLVFRNGAPVPLDEKMDGGNVEILRVVTGGAFGHVHGVFEVTAVVVPFMKGVAPALTVIFLPG